MSTNETKKKMTIEQKDRKNQLAREKRLRQKENLIQLRQKLKTYQNQLGGLVHFRSLRRRMRKLKTIVMIMRRILKLFRRKLFKKTQKKNGKKKYLKKDGLP